MKAVEAVDIGFSYRNGSGVAGIGFSARPGDQIALFGGSGCGKSTVLKLLSGELEPESGLVRILDMPSERAREHVGCAPAKTRSSRLLTIQTALAREAARRRVPATKRAARIDEMIGLLDLDEDRDRPLRDLSSGRRAALGLAAALIHHPSVLLLDNTTACLPHPVAVRIDCYLDNRRRTDGFTVIHATTSSEEAARADRVLILDRGRQVAFAPPSELLANHAADVITIEAADPAAVQRTLRGVFDVEIAESGDRLRFTSSEGIDTAAHLFRHLPEGARAIYVRPPTLWDVIDKLKSESNHEPAENL